MKNKLSIVTFTYLSIISGLVYSFMTTKLISLNLGNKFYILFLNAITSFLLFTIIFRFNTKLVKSRLVLLIGIAFALIFPLFNANTLTSIIIFYLAFSFILGFYIVDTENNILQAQISTGVYHLSFFSTLATLIGFFVGSFFNHVNVIWLSIMLITGFLLKDYETHLYQLKLNRNNLPPKFTFNLKWIFFILLSSSTVFWIPIFIGQLNNLKENNLFFIPFVLPGIVSMLLLHAFKKVDIKILIVMYLITLTFFLVLFTSSHIWGSIIIFSLAVGFNILLNMWLKTHILTDQESNNPLVLQSFELLDCSVMVIVSLLSLFFSWIPWLLIVGDFTGSLLLLIFIVRGKIAN